MHEQRTFLDPICTDVHEEFHTPGHRESDSSMVGGIWGQVRIVDLAAQCLFLRIFFITLDLSCEKTGASSHHGPHQHSGEQSDDVRQCTEQTEGASICWWTHFAVCFEPKEISTQVCTL